MTAPSSHLWTAFDGLALAGSTLENVILEPGWTLRAALQDASRPGWLLSPEIGPGSFDRAVISWNGRTPPGGRLELDLRACRQGAWTGFYPLAVWSSDPEGPRHSCPDPGNPQGGIDTDTLRLHQPAEALQIRVSLRGAGGNSPRLTGLAAVLWEARACRDAPRPWGGLALELDVPAISQQAFPEGARSWCSPTCLTMVLGYWGRCLGRTLADPVPVAARATWDSAYEGAGNWPFNTAYASTKGLRACVIRLPDLADTERILARGVPLVLSIGWGQDELPGAHLPASRGHLVVLRGFGPSGDPILNDPAAAEDRSVRSVFPRGAFERAWLGHSGGIAYLIEP